MTVYAGVRSAINGAVVTVGLAISLPLIVAAERVRSGAGRSAAAVATRLVSRLCGVTFEIQGREHLGPASLYVFVPNHSSPVDIPAMIVAVPAARFAAAAELFRVPLLGSAMRALGAIPIDRARPRDAQRAMANLSDELAEESIVVFAEGGIPAAGEHVRFKSGAFILAIQAGRAVVPVSIRGSDTILPPGRRIRARPGVVTVRLHDPIDTAHLTLADRKTLRDATQRVVRDAEPVRA